MASELERTAMQTALEAARRGRTSPNPRVGAAVIQGGAVIATGYHARAGEPHAEVVALGAAGTQARGATLIVTLMPCNHQGRTGPCTEAILDAGVSRVVVGCEDPTDHAAESAARLRAEGVDVEIGVYVDEATALIADFAKFTTQGLPWVTLKAAVTLDGKLATRSGDSKWITSDLARDEAHRLRADHDAILVGVGTVLADNPRLNVRRVEGDDPIRVVLDAGLRTPGDAALVRQESSAATWIAHADDAPADRIAALSNAGAELIAVPRGNRGVALEPLLKELAKRNIMRLLVEGGAKVHGSFLDGGFADRAAIFVAPKIVGDAAAPSFAAGEGADTIAASWKLANTAIAQLGADLLITGDITR